MSRNRVAMFLLLGFAAFCFSAAEAMRVRDEVRKLTAKSYEVRQEGARLRDASRSLRLEYHTMTDYGKIREQARQLGMREPSVEDGTMVWLPAERTQ